MLLLDNFIAGVQALAVGLVASLAAMPGGGPDGLTATPSPARHDPQWVEASALSCDKACEAVGLKGVVSGYGGNEAFFVCAANAHNGGFRAGYNYRPNWAEDCYVGWGGAEEAVRPYRCLCK